MPETATPAAATPAAAPNTSAPAPAIAAAPQSPPVAAPATGAAPTDKPSTTPAADAKSTATTAAEIEFKLPEGAKVDEKVLTEFKSWLKEAGFSSKQAQSLVDREVKQRDATQKAIEEHIAKQRAADLEAMKADKEFGGGHFEKSVADAKSALQQFGGEEASKLLSAFGLENHPAIVKAFARVRAAIAEDSIAGKTGQPPAGNTRETELQSRYNKSPQMFRR